MVFAFAQRGSGTRPQPDIPFYTAYTGVWFSCAANPASQGVVHPSIRQLDT